MLRRRRQWLIVVACLVAPAGAWADPGDEDAALMVQVGGCEKGDSTACSEAADTMKRRRIVQRFQHTPASLRARALELDAAACIAKDAAACFAQGLALARLRDASADEKIEEACALDHGPACHYRAVRMKKPAEALALLEKACNADHARSCELVAQRVAPRDPARALTLHAMACAGRDMEGCIATGKERRAQKDLPAAYNAYLTACELQREARATGAESDACVTAGMIARTGGHAAANTAQAFELFGHACSALNARGCIARGELLARGEGTPRHWGQGLAQVSEGCRLAKDTRCRPLARLVKAPPDATCTTAAECSSLCDERLQAACRREVELDPSAYDPAQFESACLAGDGASCTTRGDFATKFREAASWYERGCKARDARACLVARVNRPGAGNTSALAAACTSSASACPLYALAIGKTALGRAQAVLQKACDASVGVACRYLAQTFTGAAAEDDAWSELVSGESPGRHGVGDGSGMRVQTARELADSAARAEQASALYRKGCEAGDVKSCASARETGPGRREAPPTIVRLPAWM